MTPADRNRWNDAAALVRRGLAARAAAGAPARVSRRTFRRMVRAYLDLAASFDSVAPTATESNRDARGRFVRQGGAGG